MFSKITQIIRAFSPRERKLFYGSLIVFAVGLVGLGAYTLSEATTIVPDRGGSYSEGFVGQPAFINPVTATTEIDKSLVRLIFANLYSLSEKRELSSDGLSWRVRLTEDLLWQDGEKMTADDVVFTVQKIQDPDSRSPLAESWRGVLVERSSERELEFKLGVPYAFFESNLKNLYVLPKHLFAQIPVGNWRLSDLNLTPVGSGAYRASAHHAKANGFVTTYTMKATRAADGTEPFISTITFNFFPSKKELIAALNAGQIDGAAGLAGADRAAIERPYRAAVLNLKNHYSVFINQNQNLSLKEWEVRKALALALDPEDIAKNIFGANADPMSGPAGTYTKRVLDDEQNQNEDEDMVRALSRLEKAADILEKAGWKTDEAGFRTKTIKKSEIPLEIILTVPDILFLTETATMLESAWRTIGVRVTVRKLPPENIAEAVIKNRDYQMLLFGNILNANTDLFSYWHSLERFYPGLNLSLYANPETDKLIEEYRRTFDEQKRAEVLAKLDSSIADEFPAIFLYAQHYLYILGKDVRGIDYVPLSEPAERFRDTTNWYVKTKRVFK